MKRRRVKKSTESRLQELEDFHYRVKLGQRWFLCGVATIGSVVAFISYLLSGINNWFTFIQHK